MIKEQEKVRWDEATPAVQLERTERILKVALKMTKHQIDHHFDMGVFIRVTPCGTIGCMAGQCALDPWFAKRGMGVDITDGFYTWELFHPEAFCGPEIYNDIFMNSELMLDNPRQAHRAVVRKLRALVRKTRAGQAFTRARGRLDKAVAEYEDT